jgi:hypothetical protein
MDFINALKSWNIYTGSLCLFFVPRYSDDLNLRHVMLACWDLIFVYSVGITSLIWFVVSTNPLLYKSGSSSQLEEKPTICL